MAEPVAELTEVIQAWEVTKDSTLDDEPEILMSLLTRLQYVQQHLTVHAERNKPLSNDIKAILKQVTTRIGQVEAKLNAEDKKHQLQHQQVALHTHPPGPGHGPPHQHHPPLPGGPPGVFLPPPPQTGVPPLPGPAVPAPSPALLAAVAPAPAPAPAPAATFIVSTTTTTTTTTTLSASASAAVNPRTPPAPASASASVSSPLSPGPANTNTNTGATTAATATATTNASQPQPRYMTYANNSTAAAGAGAVASNTALPSNAPLNRTVSSSSSKAATASSSAASNPSSGTPLASVRTNAATPASPKVAPASPHNHGLSLQLPNSAQSAAPPPSTEPAKPEEKTDKAGAGPATAAVPASPPREEDPEKRFRYERTLRKALQGKVKLFTDLSTGKEVVVKHLRKDLVRRGVTDTGSPIMENPRDEAKFLTQLSALNEGKGHAHVMRLIDEYEDSTYLWYVLEFCNGGEFFDHVAKVGRLDEPTARTFFLQVMDGVKFIHARSICHLDLSLENLLMHDGAVKICDFGLARHMPENGQPFEGVASNKPGKIGYMSPEIFAGMAFEGFQCDVYSCGVILFIMLTGVPPYQFPSKGDARFKLIYSNQIRHLLGRWNFYPGVLSENSVDLLSKMLCPPEQRLTVAQVLAHPWMSEGKEAKKS